MSTGYDAFVSYSRAADDPLAQALQRALQRFGKPWYRRSALRVFRDTTSLSASPGLWPSIEAALSRARYFLLLASPAAATSKWVTQEITWWLANRSAETLLVVLTDGSFVWDDEACDIDWERTGRHPRLAGRSERLWPGALHRNPRLRTVYARTNSNRMEWVRFLGSESQQPICRSRQPTAAALQTPSR